MLNKLSLVLIFLIAILFSFLIFEKSYKAGKKNADIKELCRSYGGTPMTRRFTEKTGESVCLFTTK